jgi:predicted porin
MTHIAIDSNTGPLRVCSFVLAMVCGVAVMPANAVEPPSADAVESTGSPLVAYGTLDVMSYRLQDNTGVQRNWNLSGIRETVLGVRTSDAPEGSKDWRFVGNFEAAFGADRGERGRVYTVVARQVYAGVAGPWGQLTVGRQYNVLTNIAWSTLNPINNGWGIYFNDLLYLGDSFSHRNSNTRDLVDAGANWFLGYTQDGVQYQFKGEGYSMQAEFVPGSTSGLFRRGATTSLAGTRDIGSWTLAGAASRQVTRDGAADRKVGVLGVVYGRDSVKFYLSRMQSMVSTGARYSVDYGGVGWQANPKLHLSLGLARYRQNGSASFGIGSARGISSVAEYALTPHLNIYAEADYRRHVGGSDGAQAVFAVPGPAKNIMVGLSTSF